MFRFSVRPNRAHMIDWREWGEDAFEEARGQDKLVVLFIAAFWCGFCQRMDEAALSDDEVITLLNAFFVPIRVEESQRPDIDLRYNQTGRWPEWRRRILSLFLQGRLERAPSGKAARRPSDPVTLLPARLSANRRFPPPADC